MRKFILNILVLIGIAGLGVLAAWFVRNCAGHDRGPSPEETVREFYLSLINGQWDNARSLCVPSEDMRTYCMKFRQFREAAHEADSSALSAAACILSEAGTVLSGGLQEDGGLFTGLFTVTADGGISKTVKVELVKQRGVWLIGGITAAE